MPITTGTPTIANSSIPNRPTPASNAACEITTLTGDPVSSSSPPALPANASGMSSRDGATERRRATTITIGKSAATEPLSPMKAVSTALMAITRNSSGRTPSFARDTTSWPTQAVTPVASSPSLTTNSAAIRITAGSPNPARAWGRLSTPVA